jgi:hypothetical protein
VRGSPRAGPSQDPIALIGWLSGLFFGACVGIRSHSPGRPRRKISGGRTDLITPRFDAVTRIRTQQIDVGSGVSP